MILVHDRRALGQFTEVADDRFRLAAGTARAPGAAGALGEQLALGQHRDARIVQREAILQRCHRDREARVVGEEAGQVGHHRRLQLGGLQHFQQRLAAAG